MKKNDKGQVLILVALAIFALLGLAALGIDVGYMYSVRHELQRSADSGALAGASAFLDVGPWSTDLSTPAMVAATARALDYASRDHVLNSRLDPASEITVTFPAQDNVQVTTQRNVSLFFARIFGRTAQTISATAIAEAATATKNVKCIKPWAVSYPWGDNNLNGQYDPGETVHDTCPEGNADNTWYFCPGTVVQIKVSTQSSNTSPIPQQEPSHFFELDLGQLNNSQGCLPSVNQGAASYLAYLEDKCLDNCVQVASGPEGTGDPIPLQTGNDPRKTIQGAQWLINQDPGAYWDTAAGHPDGGNFSGTAWEDSPRVIRIPIYDPRYDQLNPGAGEIHVAEFAGMWIDHVDPIQGNEGQGTVYGRYVKLSISEAGAGSGNQGAPSLKFLRLVK
jgi:hypothetical protein